jgi:hypothetical protein
MTDATIAYKSQFWLEDTVNSPTSPATLVKLSEVRRIQMPQSAAFERAEATHLESPGRRREFVDTFYEDADFEVEMNRIPGSTTENLILALKGETGVYAARIVEYDGDVHVATHDFDVQTIGYTLSDLEADAVKIATMTYKAASEVVTTYPS